MYTHVVKAALVVLVATSLAGSSLAFSAPASLARQRFALSHSAAALCMARQTATQDKERVSE